MATKQKREIKGWITIKGNHVPLFNGEGKMDALKRFVQRAREKARLVFKGKMVEEGTKRYFQKEDGTRIEYLTTTEYNKLGMQLLNSLNEEERAIIQEYVDCFQTAGSGDLNQLTEETIGKIYANRSEWEEEYKWNGVSPRPKCLYAWNKNPDNIVTGYERDLRLLEEYNTKMTKEDKSDLWDYTEKHGYWHNDFDNVVAGRVITDKAKMQEDLDKNRQMVNLYKEKDKALDAVYKAGGKYGDEKYKATETKYNTLIKQKANELGLEYKSFSSDYQDKINYYTRKDQFFTNKYLDYVNIQEYMNRVAKGKDLDKQIHEGWNYNHVDNMKSKLEDQKKIDAIFEKHGIVLDHDIIVYRRTRETKEQIKNGFMHFGYTSTTMKSSLNKKMPSGVTFGESQTEIIIPKGTKFLPLKATKLAELHNKGIDEYDIKSIKHVANQNEILLPRNTKFNYLDTSYPKTKSGYTDWSSPRYTMVADTSNAGKNYKYKYKRKVNGEWVYVYDEEDKK